MTLKNINKVNFKIFKKGLNDEKFIIYIFSLLPISLILGNAAINLNILIIDLFFLFICFHRKKWLWIKNKYFYFFITIWIYLILNSMISENIIFGNVDISSTFDTIRKQTVFPQRESIIKSTLFIRFVIFLFAVQYFFANSKKAFDQIFLYWFIIIFVVLIDVIFESIFGHNLLGFKSLSSQRIVSFFKDELIVGNLLLGFSFLITGFLFKSINNNPKKKILSNIFFVLTTICIYLSGERSNFIKALIIASLMLFTINDYYFYLKKKYIFLLIIIGIVMSTLISTDIHLRQAAFFNRIKLYVDGSTYEKSTHNSWIRHFAHYDTAWQIFKDHPISGVGSSKFRYICHDKKYYNPKIKLTNERCSNHPHQVHLEILSEQGILGYLIILFTIFHVLLNSFKVYLKTSDITHLSSILFVIVFFLPLLPTGSLFSTFNASIFWINLSFVFAFLNKSK